MSSSDFEEFVYHAALLDEEDPAAAWLKVHKEQQRIVDFLNQCRELHFVAPGTDITCQVGGRTWINCSGKQNFPDGEVFTGPIENSMNGTILFSYPGFYNSNEVDGAQLTFRDGKVVQATARSNQAFLDAMLELDEGSCYVGEIAFGLNYNIQRFMRNTLFDEKIGGTMHMALGASLPQSGGKNISALHWDMVNSLREGKVYADSQLCYAEGKFLI